MTRMSDKPKKRVALVAGVGPGLGAALVRKLAQEVIELGSSRARQGSLANSPMNLERIRWQFLQTFPIQKKSGQDFARWDS